MTEDDCLIVDIDPPAVKNWRTYACFGRLVAIECDLPGFDAVVAGVPDLTVHWQVSEQSIAELEHERLAGTIGLVSFVGMDQAIFYIRGGREISVHVYDGGSTELAKAFLTGPAFGAAFLQSGMCPFHASAITHRGRGWIFGGRSGVGKSTTAVAMSLLDDMSIVADDLCCVDQAATDFQLCGGIRRAKLLPRSLSLLGSTLSVAGVERLDAIKYHVEPKDGSPRGKLPLAGIVLLEAGEGKSDISLCAVGGVEAFQGVSELLYWPEIPGLAVQSENVIRFVAELVEQVPVYRFRRPQGDGERLLGLCLLEQLIRSN